MDLNGLLAAYRNELLREVIPFWTTHAVDADGGLSSCIRDDGTLISRDRWCWSQWRALWVFSKLFNAIEARAGWLEIAHGLFRFLSVHGQLPNGHWPLLIGGNGKVERGYESIYTDCFAIYGLVEYWRATGNHDALTMAMNTFHAAQEAVNSDVPPPTWPYPIPPGCKPHALSMLFSLVFFELASATHYEEHLSAALKHHDQVMNQFWRSDRRVLVEWLNRDGSECAPPLGTAVCPGHAIESMWFQIHIARASNDQRAIRKAIDAIRIHLEKGWDAEYGGIFLAIDADGRENVQWPHADKKLWWPHTEALYATLLAYEFCGEEWCLEWHQRIHEYCFAHFPLREHGEWRQKLDRFGQPIHEALFLPVKDPFHLPRALIYCIEVLARLAASSQAFQST